MMTPMTPTISADQIAQCALHHYRNILPSNGGKPQRTEWTVYAAIVACRHHRNNGEEIWVVSCATGSKCTSVRPVVSSLPTQTTWTQGRKRPHADLSNIDDDHKICSCYNGMVLKDSHAETLARRGLMAVLWDEVENSLQNKPTPHPLLESYYSSESNRQKFQLRQDTSLHIYISDNPCGDATIYRILGIKSSNSAEQPETSINFTGAKIILSDRNGQSVGKKDESISSTLTCSNAADSKHASSTMVTVGREDVQQLGALRLKSSRSNIPSHLRSMSMSCSDKIVRWGVLGLQGALLSMYIPNPIVLSSVCVSKDPRAVDGRDDLGQLEALCRALKDRIESVLTSITKVEKGWNVKPPEVAVVNNVFENSKSSSEFRRQSEPGDNTSNTKKLATKESVCGLSINWHQTSDHQAAKTEVTIATGLKRGKKPKCPTDVVNAASRLSRYQFASRCRKCNSLSPETDTNCHSEAISYMKYKQILSNQTLTRIASSSVLGGTRGGGPLVGWVRGGADDDFDLPHN
ncbi:hypothetical protein ACHAXM_010227 [Skeletonema potamos]